MSKAKKNTVPADLRVLKMMVRLRDDYQKMRTRVNNRLGKKADGTDQDVERAFFPEHKMMLDAYGCNAKEMEDNLENELLRELKKYPIYNEFLAHRKGCGTIASGYIVSSINIHAKFLSPSEPETLSPKS